jgi:hypothetical protein
MSKHAKACNIEHVKPCSFIKNEKMAQKNPPK